MAVGIEGIDSVVFGRYEQYVSCAFSRNLNVWEVERLSVDVTVNVKRKQPAELVRIDVFGSETSLVEVRSRPGVIVLRRKYLRWSSRGQPEQTRTQSWHL